MAVASFKKSLQISQMINLMNETILLYLIAAYRNYIVGCRCQFHLSLKWKPQNNSSLLPHFYRDPRNYNLENQSWHIIVDLINVGKIYAIKLAFEKGTNNETKGYLLHLMDELEKVSPTLT